MPEVRKMAEVTVDLGQGVEGGETILYDVIMEDTNSMCLSKFHRISQHGVNFDVCKLKKKAFKRLSDAMIDYRL